MQSLKTLEYEKLLTLFERYAQTPMGKARLLSLQPLTNRLELERDLKAVTETIYLNEEKQVSWRFSDVFEPTNAIAVLRIRNATLEPLSLLEVTRLCSQALFARSVIAPEKESVPTLWRVIENLPPTLFAVIEKINKKLLPSGEIDDAASPELARLRREINNQRGRLTKSLETLMRNASDAIQDAIVTQRNERYVVPVKADFRGKVTGVAHGFSSSGATVFIEPLEAIEANNELQALKEKEEREVARVLFDLTEMLRGELPAIEAAVRAVAELDFIKAKVEFARSFRAVVPQITDDETLSLIEARHPLLEENLREQNQKSRQRSAVSGQQENEAEARASARAENSSDDGQSKEIVPVSFSLTKEKSVMIISGANAGGKTVVLKTAGLLSLMAISGLPVPAREARIPFYKSVLADIGDNQSLSANLSTFTSHISNIAEMMRECSNPALVLLDEVGTGTDPEEGSALGVAIVDYFRRQCSAQVIASTHYRGLKIYATNDETVINASVEFDEKTLQPTYRLLTGLAGASSGIDIARRFGIPPPVIEKARANVEVSAREASDYLLKIRRESQIAEDLRVALEEEREATAKKYALLDIEARKKEKERQKEFEKELGETIDSFERQAKAFVSGIEDKALKTRLEKEMQARKAELKRTAMTKVGDTGTRGRGDAAINSQSAFRIPQLSDRPIETGMRVLLKTFGSVGTVEKIDGETAEVMVGSMRLREKLANLQAVVAEEKKKESKLEKLQKQSGDALLRLDTENMNAELNIIGKTTSEVDDLVDPFLDEAYLNGFQRVRIVHGIGTGALRSAVHRHLKGHPHVSRYTLAPREQGGEGATVVELKQ
ncbi:MAG TPA: endonuclease MutS2 [Pyrinomonadaceae bacterium]|jgi:DNA mismatch repair protein MutS2